MNYWIVMLILGILTIVLGFVCMANPMAATLATDIVAGWSFLIMGPVIVIAAFAGATTGGKWWNILLGVLMFFTGWFLLKNPLGGVVALTIALAAFFMFSGIVQIIAGFKIVDTSLKWLAILSGVLSIILSIIMLRTPEASIGILLGAQLLMSGITISALAFARKRGGVLDS